MRRFLITSPKFKGAAELIFRADGVLVRIDTGNCNMDKEMTSLFKIRCPEHVDLINTAYMGTLVTVVESDIEITFKMFWDAYAHKINRLRALKVWNVMGTKDESERKVKQIKAYYGIKPYEKFLTSTGYRTKLDPENYLKDEIYENEYK